MKLKQLALAAMLAPLALTSHAGFTISADVGEDRVDTNRATDSKHDAKIDNSALFGGALGYRYDNGLGVELDFQHASSITLKKNGTKVGTERQSLTSLNGYYAINQGGLFQPYLLLGLGSSEYTYVPTTNTDNSFLGNAGLGTFVALNDMVSLRAEVREVHTFGLHNHNDTLGLLGIQLAFGGKPMEKTPEPAPVAPAAVEPAPVVAPPPPPLAAAPADDDNDGVPNSIDKCPNTPAGVQVDATGCPIDADGDGVPDYKDKCPNTPAGVQVDGSGCPLDADNDGVPDYLDKCPNTPAGALVDASGCPKVVTEAIKQEINVLFDNGKAIIKPEYKPEVQKVVDLVKQYPTAYIEIQGYTDNRGNAKKNQKLSEARAAAVRDSLVHDFNVDPSHITFKGYGAASPVADNKTNEGRAKNRRVIAVLTAEQKSMQMAPAGTARKAHHHHKAAQ